MPGRDDRVFTEKRLATAGETGSATSTLTATAAKEAGRVSPMPRELGRESRRISSDG